MFSHNDDGTINELGEGTLTKCKCGREFFLSFENGFICKECQKIANNKFNARLKEFFESKTFKEMKKEAREQRNERIRKWKEKKRDKV